MIYDGDQAIGEVGYDGVIKRRYVYGPGTDEPILWYEGSGTSDSRWLHADERGSIVAVSDASGNPLAINSYDEYGVPGSGNAGRLGYTGQAWLPELGLWYYKARMYAPSLGRFLQPDPIGYADGLNWYGYVGGDPVNATDPTGLEDVDGKDIIVNAPSCDGIRVNGFCLSPASIFGRGGSGLTGGGGGGATAPTAKPAPQPDGPDIVVTAKKPQNTKQTFAQCALAAAKKNAGVLALDAVSIGASFVPGGKGVVTAAAAAVGSTTGVAALGIGVVNRDIPGAAIGAAGHYVSVGAYLLEGAKGLASNLPVAGQAIAIGGALYDSYNALKEGGCLGGGK